MKSILYASIIIVLVACVAGCASTANESKFTADTITQIKTGMTKSDVTVIVGEPRSRSVDNDGDEIWQYRKNGSEGKAVKAFADITSFGLTSNTDAEYQDILTVMFKTNAVSKVTYQENVHNLNALERQN
jgi:outer membrane protein assembly factor BamE (lipoprotein component of BamABCDE complex)